MSAFHQLIPLALVCCAGSAVFAQTKARFLNLSSDTFVLRCGETPPELHLQNGKILLPDFQFGHTGYQDRQYKSSHPVTFEPYCCGNFRWEASPSGVVFCYPSGSVDLEPQQDCRAPEGVETGTQVTLSAQFSLETAYGKKQPLGTLNWVGLATVVEADRWDKHHAEGVKYLRFVEGAFLLEGNCVAKVALPGGKMKPVLTFEPMGGGHLMVRGGLGNFKTAVSAAKPSKSESKAGDRQTWE